MNAKLSIKKLMPSEAYEFSSSSPCLIVSFTAVDWAAVSFEDESRGADFTVLSAHVLQY